MEEKKLGLKSVISVSVGLVIATSCLVSLGQGAGTIGVTFIFAMVIACLFNMTTIASLSELNALMPNTTGGLAQYTLACLGPFPTMISMVGGYLFCNVLSSGVEASIFAYAMGEIFHLPIPNFSYTVLVTVILLIANKQPECNCGHGNNRFPVCGKNHRLTHLFSCAKSQHADEKEK